MIIDAKSIMKRTLFTLLASLLVSFAFSQPTIRGKLIDGLTKQSIEGVHIYLKSGAYGTVSNSEGGFEFPYTDEDTRDTIIFSHLNYEPLKFALSDLSTRNEPIEMNISITNLADVTLVALDPEEILRNVIDNYSENYYPINYKGVIKQTSYYDDNIMRFLMADIIIKEKKQSNAIYRVSDRYCKKQSEDYDDRLKNNIGILQMVSFTKIKPWLSSFVKNLDEFAEVYVNQGNYGNYKTYELYMIQNITETQKTTVKLVIDAESKAIISIEMTGDRGEGIDKWRTFYESDEETISGMHTSGYIYIKYRPYNGKWMLSEAKAKGTVSILYKTIEGAETLVYNTNDVHIVVNELNTKRVKKKNRIDPTLDLFNQIEFTKKYKLPKGISLTEKELEFAALIVLL